MAGKLAKLAASALCLVSLPSAIAVKKDKIEADVMDLRAFSLEPPYLDEGFQIRSWDYGGDTIIDSMNGIHLTADLASRQGWLWSTNTLPNDYWRIDFEFKIGGKGGYLFGDGMGVFVTKERATSGPVFGSKDYFTGLGVFFDTYPNSKHDFSVPFVMGMLGDGKTPYDAVHDGDANRLGMCEAYFRNLKDRSKARMTYLKGQLLHLQLQLQPKDKWIHCFSISNITLPENPYLGFSALTGDISDRHDLVRVKASTLRPDAIKNVQVPGDPMPLVQQPVGSSFFGIFIKLVIVSAVFGGVFVAYKKYSANSAKRF